MVSTLEVTQFQPTRRTVLARASIGTTHINSQAKRCGSGCVRIGWKLQLRSTELEQHGKERIWNFWDFTSWCWEFTGEVATCQIRTKTTSECNWHRTQIKRWQNPSRQAAFIQPLYSRLRIAQNLSYMMSVNLIYPSYEGELTGKWEVGIYH